MTRSIVIYLFTITFSFFSLTIQAQKPNAIKSFEKTLTVEEPAWYMDKNMRKNAENGFAMAIYNSKYKVTPAKPEAMARQYLNEHKINLGLTDQDIQNLQLHAIRNGQAGTTVRFRQYLNGYPVEKAEITIQINEDHEVCFVMNNFKHGITLTNFDIIKSVPFAKELLTNSIPNLGIIQHEKERTEIFVHNGQPKLIHRVSIIANEPAGEWEAFVDANTGELIKLEDVSFYYHDHKEALLPGLPYSTTMIMMAMGTGSIFNPDPLSSGMADYGDTGYSDNGDATSSQLDAQTMSVPLLDITFDGTNYSLVGPWAEIRDFESPMNGLYTQSSDIWNFNRSDDGFEATNTYYHIDASMRYINIDLGLAIKPTDYSGGVRFDPHGLNGADNSHYLGGSQQVSFGEGGVDDAEDSDVIHHELGHGLHDWVTNGGLSQVNGLSEGCGDYWAASYNRGVGNWTSSDPAYNWVFNWDGHNPFWNGRIVNYAPTYPGGLTGAIHTDGQIWSTAMMNVWNDIGQIQADKAFWEGLGMTNGGSNQNDAANAVYQAAINMGYSNTTLIDMNNALTNSGYMLPLAPLPVEFVDFSGRKDGQRIELFWTTSSEVNHKSFEIERSLNGFNFEKLGIVNSHGNSEIEANYSFVDMQPSVGTNYYRLKSIDQDYTFSHSEVLAFTFDQSAITTIYPNPVTNELNIESGMFDEPNVELSIYDAIGRLVKLSTVKDAKQETINTADLQKGWYILKISTERKMETLRFLKE